ncbi:unnamed protein product [Cladocopium goreaui]|uniref:Sushi, von Willebrand factor type A, EGF and pentraxin domain-containing protein 1 n=1 Tax=Cladocopium goreaui TaxID=2562237 RepID=A0A9P1BLD5_9DINO|nr:unnamed protein product [Cladocopium goreaui]
MIMVITATRLLTTFLQSSAPSLCYWASKSCMSCTELYEVNIHLAAAAVNFILCSFALAFVFTFEHTFDEYLRQIGPFWKFWGVKGVVSVTYFQWVVLSYGPFNLEDKRIYLLHCLLMTLEMPLLAVIHSSCAYPYGKPWLEYLLLLQQKDMREELEETGGSEPGPSVEETDESTTTSQVDNALVCLFYLVYWVLGCVLAHRFVVFVLPVRNTSTGPRPPIFNKTCTQDGDIWHYIANHPDLHFHMQNDTIEKHRMPNIGGAWLQLCGQTDLDCAAGFVGSAQLRCSPTGSYTYKGECTRIRCGQPKEEVGHARLHEFGQIRRWTSDMEISYECVRGYIGRIRGICGKDGVWRLKGECTEVVCPNPPLVPRAKPLLEPHELENRTWQAGTSLRYQCEEPFTGTITATCEDDGSFQLQGRCVRRCTTPPALPNSIAVYNNSLAQTGFFEGLRVTYQCSPGYGGTLVATCREDGKYSVEGGCKLRCTDLQSFLQREFGASWKDELHMNSSENLDLTGTGQADLVPLRCGVGLEGQPLAACHEGKWRLLGDACRPFQTSQGCRCKLRWKYCKGLFQNKCILWHGCHPASENDALSWCQVEANTCGRNTWDYCVGEGLQEATEVVMPSETRAVFLRFGLCAGAVVLLAIALLWIWKLRLGRGCGRELARSSQSESARRPEALELQATQSNP